MPVKNLSISTNFFSTSKHKIISIEIENLWIRPLDSIVKKKNCYIPIGIWAEPEFIEESNNLIMSDTKWIDKFNESRQLFDERYKPAGLENMPSYPNRSSTTGQFIDEGPLAANAYLK